LRVDGIEFRAIDDGQPSGAVPHFHAFTENGEIVIDMLPAGEVVLSPVHGDPIRGTVTPPELKMVLDAARKSHASLLKLWRQRRASPER
jgi:hypothetical protein